MTLAETLQSIASASDLSALQQAFDHALGKEGRLSQALKNLKNLSKEEKQQQGKILTNTKQEILSAYHEKMSALKAELVNGQLEKDSIDISVAAPHFDRGVYSLLNLTRRRLEDIAQQMGFVVEYGHDMVTKFENFISLNIPLTHPATEMHDTFFLEDKDESGENYVLRTHTTAMDNSLIKEYGVPCKIVIPSKVYRYEATDASHDTTFYQFEGIYIDEGISIAHFKSFIQEILSSILETSVDIRMRPGYFPFVEPGFEIDASCPLCRGSGCSLCKNTGWIEIIGAGMLHPEVLRQAGVDHKKYSGFAFGMGVNRLVAVKYRIKDIRLFTNGDLRFSKSFDHAR